MLQKVIGEPEFQVRCLGGLTLLDVRRGTDMTPAKRKPRALLGYLCIERKPVGRERLASLLWGDRGDEQARASLRQTLYELRSPLGGDRLLRTEGDMVAIGEYVSTDIDAITAAAQSGDLGQLRNALSGWRGEILEDLSSIDAAFDAWLEAARVRIQETLFDAARDAVRRGMARGEIEQARKIIGLLQERDGTNEIVCRLGLELDHLAGDSAAIHRRYEQFRKLLKSELDATPSTETQRLFHELAAGTSAPVGEIASRPHRDGADNETTRVLNGGAVHTLPAQFAGDGITEKTALASSIRRGQTIQAAVAASTIIVLAALAWVFWNPLHKAPPPRAEPLLAVLPFQNLSTDSGSRYFSDGMTEDIVDALLRITQIRVAAPGSSFQFRAAGAHKAATALAATHILNGSVQRHGDRIQVMAQLTDVRDGRIVWSHAYDRTVAGTPALQRDIAVQIADALDMRLSSNALGEAQQVVPEAYDHYLKGRDLFLQRDAKAAAVELEASVHLAPNFARAWATLAAVRFVLASRTLDEQKEDYAISMERSARTAAQRALRLDPRNGEALAVVAQITPFAHLPEIDRMLERAVQSEPNNTQLLNWRGIFLMMVGRRREALDALTRAYELDRVTPSVTTNLILDLMEMGEFERAATIIDTSGDNRFQSEFLLLRAEYFLFQRDWPGLAEYLSVLPGFLSPRAAAFLHLWRETALALSTHDSGKFSQLRTSWLGAESTLAPDDAALFLLALGAPDGALKVIKEAVSSQQTGNFLTDPGWDAIFAPGLAELRRDPRVPALLAQWGLFGYWRTTNHWPDFCDEPTLPFDCKVEAQKFMHAVAPHAVVKRS